MGKKSKYNKTHISFISKTSGKQFMEVHHLIPLNKQNLFSQNIDIHQNMISLCPNCHRILHHASENERNKILELLFLKRSNELEKCGIKITLEKLIDMY